MQHGPPAQPCVSPTQFSSTQGISSPKFLAFFSSKNVLAAKHHSVHHNGLGINVCWNSGVVFLALPRWRQPRIPQERTKNLRPPGVGMGIGQSANRNFASRHLFEEPLGRMLVPYIALLRKFVGGGVTSRLAKERADPCPIKCRLSRETTAALRAGLL